MSLNTNTKRKLNFKKYNKVPVDSLKNKIDNNELTLEECIENGLSQDTVDEIHFHAELERNKNLKKMLFMKKLTMMNLSYKRLNKGF